MFWKIYVTLCIKSIQAIQIDQWGKSESVLSCCSCTRQCLVFLVDRSVCTLAELTACLLSKYSQEPIWLLWKWYLTVCVLGSANWIWIWGRILSYIFSASSASSPGCSEKAGWIKTMHVCLLQPPQEAPVFQVALSVSMREGGIEVGERN